MLGKIKIEAFPNGAHDNLMEDELSVLEPGWAVMEVDPNTLPNFPFGNFEVENVDGVPHMVADSWEPLPMPGPVPLTPAQQRKEAYTTQAVIAWNGEMLTVNEAAQEWQYYAAENNTKADELSVLITAAKQAIREQYPDAET